MYENDGHLLAQKVADVMYSRDAAAQALNIEVQYVDEGNATLLMQVRDDMLNGLGICHGGMIFALADTAFAYACNSYNFNTIASGCSIDYVAPANKDDTLIAVAEERTRSGRTGVYDVTVMNQEKKVIALFRGNSYRIKGEVIPNTEEEDATS